MIIIPDTGEFIYHYNDIAKIVVWVADGYYGFECSKVLLLMFLETAYLVQ